MITAVSIDQIPQPIKIVLPGGAALEVVNTLQVGKSPIDPIQPALAPLVPIFDIIGAVLSLFNIIKTIIDALGPPPDPAKIVDLVNLIPELSAKMVKLTALIPQLAIPQTIIGLIDFVINTLEQTLKQLEALQGQSAKLVEVSARAEALGDSDLQAIADVSQANIDQEVKNLGITLGSTNSLMAVLNVFLSLLGLPTVPDLSSLSGLPIDGIVEPIEALIATLRSVRETIPLP